MKKLMNYDCAKSDNIHPFPVWCKSQEEKYLNALTMDELCEILAIYEMSAER